MVSCKVCTEDFTLGERAPLLLPCGHTFCRQCLDLIQSMPLARCPTCMMTLCGVALNHLTINYDLITTEENCLAADTSSLAHIQGPPRKKSVAPNYNLGSEREKTGGKIKGNFIKRLFRRTFSMITPGRKKDRTKRKQEEPSNTSLPPRICTTIEEDEEEDRDIYNY
nr:E3 ubiquitin-protein ligase TRIM32-like [Cherax quadricarinatus]